MEFQVFAFIGIFIGALIILGELRGKKMVGVFASLLILLLAVIVLTDGLTFPSGTTIESDCCGGDCSGPCSNTTCRVSTDCCAGLACDLSTGLCTAECNSEREACYSDYNCCSPFVCANNTDPKFGGICELRTSPYTTITTTTYSEPVFASLPAGITFSILMALVLGLLGMFGLMHYSLYLQDDLNGRD